MPDSDPTKAKLLRALGVKVEKPMFAPYDFEVKEGKDKGKKIRLMSITNNGVTKGLTKNQADAIKGNIEAFAKAYDECWPSK
jgi:hypothetical protein